MGAAGVADSERLELRVLAFVLFGDEGAALARSLTAEQFASARSRILLTISQDWYSLNQAPMESAVLDSRLISAGRSGPEAVDLLAALDAAWTNVAGQNVTKVVQELKRSANKRKHHELCKAARAALTPPNVELEKAFELLALARKVANDNAADGGAWQPTETDLTSGLEHLSRILLKSRARFLELASMPVTYTWQDILVAGTIGVLAGAPGSGKTTLAFLYIAARASNGGAIMLIGRQVYPAKPGQRLLIIEAEHSESSAARKLLASLRLLGIDDSVLEGDRVMMVARKAVTLGSPAWKECVRLIAAGFIADIVIDTIARFAPADANAEADQVAIYEQIAKALEQAPADKPPTCLLVAHTRKGAAAEDIEGVSGSTQRVGQADTVMLAEATREGGRVLSTRVTTVKLREDPGDRWPGPHTFTINGGQLVQEKAAPAPPAPDKKAAAEAERQRKHDDEAQELADLVSDVPGLGTRELRKIVQEKLGWGTERFERVAKHLQSGVRGMRLVNRSNQHNACEWVIRRDESTRSDPDGES
jgi:hypothetical protein